MEQGVEEGSGERNTEEMKEAAGGMSIAGSGSRCGLWSIRESLPEFCYVFFCLPDLYLFFKLIWPVPVLLTGMTCSWEMEVS